MFRNIEQKEENDQNLHQKINTSLTEKDYSIDCIWSTKKSCYIFKKRLGEGSYAVTYRGTYDGKSVAIKKSKQPYDMVTLESILKTFQTEQAILEKIEKGRQANAADPSGYNFLIQYYGTSTFTKNRIPEVVFVIELANQGSLEQWLLEDSFTWPMRHNIVKNVAEGLHCLHQLKIVHGDIKPSNILLTKGPLGNLQGKICDYGLAKEVDNKVDRCGSVIYLDPQVIEAKEPRNTPLDIWSLGVMIYELFERKEAYSDQGFVQFWEIARYIVDEQQTNVITVPDEINLEGKEAKIISKQAEKASVLLTWCCQFQRSARPAAHELVTELSTGPEVISDNLAMKIKRV